MRTLTHRAHSHHKHWKVHTIAAAGVALLAACGGGIGAGSSGATHLTSGSGKPYHIEWDSFVYVPQWTPIATVQAAITLQTKSFLGAGRGLNIELENATQSVDPSTWVWETVTVPETGQVIERVRFHYSDTALVGDSVDTSVAAQVPLLFGDYPSRASELIPACSDDQTTDGDSLWYHYTPTLPSCQQAITTEESNIDAASAKLQPGQIDQTDANRRFVTIRPKLTKLGVAPVKYPEYDRLLGFGSDRSMIVVYAFFGVEHDESATNDWGLIEEMRFIRTLRQTFSAMGVTYTNPYGLLLNYTDASGNPIPGVTYESLASWIVDGTGFPASIGSDPSSQEALKQQVRAAFAERWVYFDQPVTITMNGQTRNMTLEIRTFWGCEDGTADCRQHAIWRYLEAFWNADVFVYSGHSHFGHGPLEPSLYWSGNFPADRYQVFMFDSCLSYDYYDDGFLAMHPGGSKNLDVVVNGLPAYWEYMGQTAAEYIVGLVQGQKSWGDLLTYMETPDPLGSSTPYDPMRAVNGELDNVYTPAGTGAITTSW